MEGKELMGERNFRKMLEAKWADGKSVCVGLDSDLGKIPECSHWHPPMGGHAEATITAFNAKIVEATRDLVCAYKPNFAFYVKHGEEGLRALRQTIDHIRTVAPDVPVILDAKFGDIGNTNEGYAVLTFDVLGADAVTVSPYLGGEALAPFIDRKDKGIIVLCRTSNKGGDEFQSWDISGDVVDAPSSPGYMQLSHFVAYQVADKWNKYGNCAVVVGATYPEELREIRKIVYNLPILIPGVGFQQEDVPLEEQVKQVVEAGKDSCGTGMIINSSRAIIFASSGGDFAEAARREAEKLHDLINQYR